MTISSKHSRLTYLLATYIITVVVFIVAKAGFMLYQWEAEPVSMGEAAAVVGHGMTLDLSTSVYLVLLPYVCIMLSLWVKGWRWMRHILCGYHLLTALALSLVFVCDASLYEFWHFRLSASALDYLEQPSGITQSVSTGFLLLRLVAIALLTFVLYRLYVWLLPRHVERLPLKWRIASTVVAVAGIAPLIIALRGGTEVSTTNIGQAYFSQRQYLNHAAVNPLFNFLSTFKHNDDGLAIYNVYSNEECERLTAGVYTTESIGCDTLLNTRRPNVVVILLEGCGAIFTKTGGMTAVTPNLNRLMDEVVNFTNCYGTSWRTDRGTVCALSGYPSLPNVSVMKMPEKSQSMPSIASSLQQVGYETSYLYGGDINFTNMRSYLVATGFEHLTSMDDFTDATQRSAKWGVHDEVTFEALAKDIMKTHHKPFLIGYSTLSSHEPWDVPTKHLDDKVLNAFNYLDGCIGKFVARLKQSKAWDNLLIVLIPDHGISYGRYDNTQPERNRIPMLWIGGAVKAPRTINTLCNQSDMAATLLGQMGIDHKDFPFSRDVMSKTYTYPTAMHTNTSSFLLIDSTGHIIFDLDFKQFTSRGSKDSQRLLKLGKALMQSTAHDLKNR